MRNRTPPSPDKLIDSPGTIADRTWHFKHNSVSGSTVRVFLNADVRLQVRDILHGRWLISNIAKSSLLGTFVVHSTSTMSAQRPFP